MCTIPSLSCAAGYLKVCLPMKSLVGEGSCVVAGTVQPKNKVKTYNFPCLSGMDKA